MDQDHFKFGKWYPIDFWPKIPHVTLIVTDGNMVLTAFWCPFNGGYWEFLDGDYADEKDQFGDITHFMVLPPPN